MRRYQSKLFSIIIIILLILQGLFIYAQPDDLLAVSLIIDTSGSMNQTDPQRLRQTAANLFVDLLSNDDYLGIITFNSDVDLVIPIEQLKDDNIRNSFKNTISNRLTSLGDTDYKAAFDMANSELSKIKDNNARKVIVFLTDGEPDPNEKTIKKNTPAMEQYMNSLWDTISELGRKNLPVYSIGFSDGIDVSVLEKIAADTQGDVRIFENAKDFDANLIQMLKSREYIALELLALTYENDLKIKPTLSTDFWTNKEGYRKGEEVIVSASINLGNNRMKKTKDLIVDIFKLDINYQDGAIESIPLYDNGDSGYGDILSNDGIWSNKVVFNKNGNANANFIVSGKYKEEDFKIEKHFGEFLVDNPGKIIINSFEKSLWSKRGKVLSIPLYLNNQSSFKEIVFIDIDESIAKLDKRQIELEPNSKSHIKINLSLSSELGKGNYNIKFNIRALNPLSTIEPGHIDYDIEIISSLENLSRKFKSNYNIIIIILIVFIGLPLIIFVLGMLLYLIIIKSKTNMKGILTYWDGANPHEKIELDLTKKRQKRIIISFNPNAKSDFYIQGSKFNYDIEFVSESNKKRMAFISGWIALFTKDLNISQYIQCTKPGIIMFNEDIYTKIVINSDIEFSSGGFGFYYHKPSSRWNKDENEGKNLLEGRI